MNMLNKPPTTSTPWVMLLFGYYSFVYLIIGAFALYLVAATSAKTIIIISWLYLIPPLVCRLWITLSGKPEGQVNETHPYFIRWWGLTQLQMIYSRLPLLEELLRLVPGLYNIWLCLWGGRVHMTVFWSPGVHVFDRYHLEIGKGVVVGGGSTVGAHVINRDVEGCCQLCIAPLLIEQGATIGMNASVGPGVHVQANTTVPAGRIMKPFQQWPIRKKLSK